MDQPDRTRDLINKINLALEKDRDRLSADDRKLLQEAVEMLEEQLSETTVLDRLSGPHFVVAAKVIAKLLKFFHDVL